MASRKVGPHQQQIIAFCAGRGLPAPETEQTFHPTRKWRWDLSWPRHRVALEVDGGAWSGGRHTRGKGFESDREKHSEGQLLGWLVLAATTQQVERGVVYDWVERALALRDPEPAGDER